MAGIVLGGGNKKWKRFDADTEVQIRLITKPELRAIAKKAAKTARLTGQDQTTVADRLLGRAVVTGWRKIGDQEHPGIVVDGKPFPFSQDNLDALMAGSIKFSSFVNETCVDQDEFIDDSGEDLDASKNVL